jgi:GH24 family phage-related lysozyme (muramidase)
MEDYSKDFLNFLMEQENASFLQGKSPALHDSPEGGNPTVGFGHKLSNKELKEGKVYGFDIYKMTPEQAREVMVKDLQKHKASLASELGDAFNNLDQRRKEMLLDFQYNLGSVKRKFPKFTKAVIENDEETMNKEYKRFYETKNGERLPLQSRNEAFEKIFLRPNKNVELAKRANIAKTFVDAI